MHKIGFRLIVLFILFSLILPLDTTFAADTAPKPISVVVDGLLQKIDPAPINENGVVLIDAKTLFNMLGLTKYSINVESGYVTFDFFNTHVYFEQGKKVAKINIRENALPAAPKIVDGHFFLPLRYVAEFCFIYPKWDPDTSFVYIDTKAEDYSVIGSIKKTINYDGYTKFTLDEAVSKVYKESHDITVLDNAIDDAQEELDDLYLDVRRLRASPPLNPFDLVDMERQLRSYQDTIDKSKINKTLFRLNKEYAIINSLTSIENTEYDIMVLQKKIALEETNIKNLELKQSVGYATEVEIKTAKDNLSQSKINLQNLNINLSNLKIDLNNNVLVGLKEKVFIDYSIDTSNLVVDSLEKYIETKKDKDLNIQLKDIDFRNAWLYKDTHYQADNSKFIRERNGLEKDSTVDDKYDTALNTLEKAKDNLDYNIRKAYNNIKLLNEQYKLKELDRVKAIDTYKTTLVRYQTGNATIFELQQAEMNILNAEVAVKQNRISYSMSKYTFNNTELLK